MKRASGLLAFCFLCLLGFLSLLASNDASTQETRDADFLDDLIWATVIQKATGVEKLSLGVKYVLINNTLVSQPVPMPETIQALIPTHPDTLIRKKQAPPPESRTHLSVFYWHLSDDDPSQTYKYPARFQRLIEDMPKLKRQHQLAHDLYIFTGLEEMASYTQITELCKAILSPATNDPNNDVACPVITDEMLSQLPELSPYMLQYRDYLIISPHPLRGLLIQEQHPYMGYKISHQHKPFFATTLIFAMEVEDKLIKLGVIASRDHFNLDVENSGWKLDWRYCIVDVFLRDLKAVLMNDEPAIIVARVFNPEIRPKDITNWLFSVANPATKNLEFQPEVNSLSMEIAQKYQLYQSQRQHTQIFYYKKSKRLKSTNVSMRVVPLKSDTQIVPEAYLFYNAFWSYWNNSEQVYSRYYSPYHPQVADIMLPDKHIRRSGGRCVQDYDDESVKGEEGEGGPDPIVPEILTDFNNLQKQAESRRDCIDPQGKLYDCNNFQIRRPGYKTSE